MRVYVIQKLDHDKSVKIAVKMQNSGEPKKYAREHTGLEC